VRDLDVKILTETTARLLVEANYRIPPDILAGLRQAAAAEESELGRQTLEHLIHNYEVAAAERLPVCQDSGITVVLPEVGQDVHWTGGNLQEAIFDGITQGTKQGYLRWSLAGHPSPLYIPAGGRPALLAMDSVFLGAFASDSAMATFEDRRVAVGPGDRLVLYTDGLTEAPGSDGGAYGLERLRQLLDRRGNETLNELRESLWEDLNGYTRGEFPDDVAFILVEF